MPARLVVAASPISGHIYAGSLLKDGCTWRDGKIDVTGMSCSAVAQHALLRGGAIVVNCNGKPKYEITVKEL